MVFVLFRLVVLLPLVVLTLEVLVLYRRDELARVAYLSKHRTGIHVYERIGEHSVSIYISPQVIVLLAQSHWRYCTDGSCSQDSNDVRVTHELFPYTAVAWLLGAIEGGSVGLLKNGHNCSEVVCVALQRFITLINKRFAERSRLQIFSLERIAQTLSATHLIPLITDVLLTCLFDKALHVFEAVSEV